MTPNYVYVEHYVYIEHNVYVGHYVCIGNSSIRGHNYDMNGKNRLLSKAETVTRKR